MTQVFSVQDRSGTAAQLTTAGNENPVSVGDTGLYNGLDWQGNPQSLPFTVGAVNDADDFCITSLTPSGGPGEFLTTSWPDSGTVTWLTGANAHTECDVDAMNVANAYITPTYLASYAATRGGQGSSYPESPLSAVQQAIVQASDYLDQRYRFRGVKLFQWLANPNFDPMITFIDPWLGMFGYAGGYGGGYIGNDWPWFTPSATFQHTEWPRAGAVDDNGDNVYSVPLLVQMATAEAALRVLAGTNLQPDYNTSLILNGGVVKSTSQQVGPIKTQTTYDTERFALLMPDFPHIRRILKPLIRSSGGRSIIR